MDHESQRVRIDFEMDTAVVDEHTGRFSAALRPDPRRYEWRILDGQKRLYDKLESMFLPPDVLEQIAGSLQGAPLYYQPAAIGDAEAYVTSRQVPISLALAGARPAPSFEDKSDTLLRSLAGNTVGFAIVSLDVVRSSELAAALDPQTYAMIMRILLDETSRVLPLFRGHVLKYTGDGMVCYLPEPLLMAMCDLAVDCATTLMKLIYRAINPALGGAGYPQLDVRIGVDASEAFLEVIGSPDTKQQVDILGEVVSLAAKIQQSAQPGEVRLGATAASLLDTMWRHICEPVDLPERWPYRDSTGGPYGVFRLKPGARVGYGDGDPGAGTPQ